MSSEKPQDLISWGFRVSTAYTLPAYRSDHKEPWLNTRCSPKVRHMKTFQITYKWQDREYSTVMPGPTAIHAMWLAQLQIMNGAKIIGVGVAR